MGCGDACPLIPGRRYIDWDLPDPRGQSVEVVRETREEIARRIDGLLGELELRRFVDAQDEAGTYERALAELRGGHKTSHWMWFVFPQIAGLGQSAMSRTYAIASLAEARTYLAHPVLGPRLLECTGALATHFGKTAVEILGAVDALKLHSSMTLFTRAAPDEPLFRRVLDRYYGGRLDAATERLLRPPRAES